MSPFSPFSSPTKLITDDFKLIPSNKAAKTRPVETIPVIETSNKFVRLMELENQNELPTESPKISLPTINLKLTEDYNLTLQEICRQFPKTNNKFNRGFIRITSFSLEQRNKIIEFLNQSGKEYVVSEAPENRPVKTVIKGLPTTHNKDLIAKELQENNFKF
ncbi:hypothetical protein AVEN_234523-1 [Araneus ventricosus]|uniref:Pre-C2HC domain-containing protein n=1 Tax=Araneus ventricosus TaxID=182803 RepID=A0A4Y2AAA1_ARAVE|nr:hypothetical protein AVEN_234523-1 [Araneus ventricosus]